MSVPPTNKNTSSTPAGKGKPDEHEDGKNFKLPTRKEQVSEKKGDPEKKKGVFDLAKEGTLTIKENKQELSQELSTESLKASELKPIEAAQQINQISALIQRTVESMQIGKVGETQFARLNLKENATEIPTAFAGTNMTVSYELNSLKIHFDNFMTPQHQNEAISLVEKNKEQLQQMVDNLQSKNIQVTELLIGSHTVGLPRAQALPPPFQAPATAQAESEQRERQGGGQQQQQNQGDGGPR